MMETLWQAWATLMAQELEMPLYRQPPPGAKLPYGEWVVLPSPHGAAFDQGALEGRLTLWGHQGSHKELHRRLQKLVEKLLHTHQPRPQSYCVVEEISVKAPTQPRLSTLVGLSMRLRIHFWKEK